MRDEKVCKICGCWLEGVVGEVRIQSSDNILMWDICKSCMIEHCCSTNCLGCEYNSGDYHKCKFYMNKKYYMKDG